MAVRLLIGAIALTVVGTGGVAAAKSIKQNITSQQACSGLRSYVAQSGLMVRGSEGTRKVVILGDSYSAGDGLQNRRDSWAYRIGASEGWASTVAGVGSTGFTDPGYCGEHVFASRIDAALATGPDLLIIQGGLNDADESSETIKSAADALLDKSQDVPQVVVVGPVKAPAVPDIAHVEEALAQSAKDHQREYISTSGWDLQFLPDELHLTPEGHGVFAGKVAQALRP